LQITCGKKKSPIVETIMPGFSEMMFFEKGVKNHEWMNLQDIKKSNSSLDFLARLHRCLWSDNL